MVQFLKALNDVCECMVASYCFNVSKEKKRSSYLSDCKEFSKSGLMVKALTSNEKVPGINH